MAEAEKIKEEILRLTRDYYNAKYGTGSPYAVEKPYVEGDRIPYAGRTFDEEEMVNLVDSSLEFWLTAGRYAKKFEDNCDALGSMYKIERTRFRQEIFLPEI